VQGEFGWVRVCDAVIIEINSHSLCITAFFWAPP
jgi:hypothetical protein